MKTFPILFILLGALALLPAFAARGEPDDTARRFHTGMAAMQERESGARETHPDRAVAAFRSVPVNRPGLVRVRLERARAFFLKGEDALARRHFEQVLAGKPPAPVAANIQRFLRTIRARRRREAHFGAALAPDSNLNAVSGNRTIFLDTPFGRLPFTRQGDITPKSGLGLPVWGGGEYQVALTPRLGLRMGADASVREYKGGDFDRHSLSAHIGPRRLTGAHTEASLLATVDRQWTAGLPEADHFGLRLEAEHRLTPRLAAFGQARRRTAQLPPRLRLSRRPGGRCVAWRELGSAAGPALGGNAGWSWSRAASEHWRNAGPQIGLGAILALPAGFTVGLRGSLRRTEYQGQGLAHATIDRKPRADETQTLSVSVHNRAVTVLGFSPRLSLINEKRDTNAQALDYERNRAELSFVRQF